MKRGWWIFAAGDSHHVFLVFPGLRFYDLLHSSSRFFFNVNTLTRVVFNQGGLALGRNHRLGSGFEAVELLGCWHEGIRVIFDSPNVVMIAEWSVCVPHSPLSLLGCGLLAGSLPRTQEWLCWLAVLSVSGLEVASLSCIPLSVCSLLEATALASQLDALTMAVL